MTTPKLELFFYYQCPFCARVLQVIEELGIKVELCNTLEDEKHANRLMSDTGRRTVPCLYIDNKPMFESADIMNWLVQNQANLAKA